MHLLRTRRKAGRYSSSFSSHSFSSWLRGANAALSGAADHRSLRPGGVASRGQAEDGEVGSVAVDPVVADLVEVVVHLAGAERVEAGDRGEAKVHAF